MEKKNTSLKGCFPSHAVKMHLQVGKVTHPRSSSPLALHCGKFEWAENTSAALHKVKFIQERREKKRKNGKKEDLPLMERHFMSALSAVCCLEAVYAPPFIPRIFPPTQTRCIIKFASFGNVLLVEEISTTLSCH